MTNAWIITTNEQVANLVEAGRQVGASVTVVAVSENAPAIAGVDRVVHIAQAQGTPAEAYAPAVVAVLAEAAGDVVLVPNRSAERIFGGAVAAALNLPMAVGASKVTANSAELERFGGISQESVSFTGAVLVMEGGAAVDGDVVAAEVVEGAPHAASVVSVQPAAGGPANLAAARRIVSCGRGFKAEEDLQMARDLAEAMGGEIACSRPLAEGSAWISKDRYIGVSGMRVAPEIYVALGISGQIQHTSGMSGTKFVVAVNNDANAPIFEIADFGIVGDIYEVVPALTAALA